VLTRIEDDPGDINTDAVHKQEQIGSRYTHAKSSFVGGFLCERAYHCRLQNERDATSANAKNQQWFPACGKLLGVDR
jgi:hypothetical protein